MAIVQAVHRPISPVSITLVIGISYIILDIFAHIIGVGVDTVFVCYLEDLERNSNSGNMYASPELQEHLKRRAAKIHSEQSNAINNN